jgi:hypothetical protein
MITIEQLKKFCKDRNCKECPFEITDIVGLAVRHRCKLTYQQNPSDWDTDNIEYVVNTQLYMETSRRPEAKKPKTRMKKIDVKFPKDGYVFSFPRIASILKKLVSKVNELVDRANDDLAKKTEKQKF